MQYTLIGCSPCPQVDTPICYSLLTVMLQNHLVGFGMPSLFRFEMHTFLPLWDWLCSVALCISATLLCLIVYHAQLIWFKILRASSLGNISYLIDLRNLLPSCLEVSSTSSLGIISCLINFRRILPCCFEVHSASLRGAVFCLFAWSFGFFLYGFFGGASLCVVPWTWFGLLRIVL